MEEKQRQIAVTRNPLHQMIPCMRAVAKARPALIVFNAFLIYLGFGYGYQKIYNLHVHKWECLYMVRSLARGKKTTAESSRTQPLASDNEYRVWEQLQKPVQLWSYLVHFWYSGFGDGYEKIYNLHVHTINEYVCTWSSRWRAERKQRQRSSSDRI